MNQSRVYSTMGGAIVALLMLALAVFLKRHGLDHEAGNAALVAICIGAASLVNSLIR